MQRAQGVAQEVGHRLGPTQTQGELTGVVSGTNNPYVGDVGAGDPVRKGLQRGLHASTERDARSGKTKTQSRHARVVPWRSGGNDGEGLLDLTSGQVIGVTGNVVVKNTGAHCAKGHYAVRKSAARR